jgi:osmotically-inducible protein OsmY
MKKLATLALALALVACASGSNNGYEDRKIETNVRSAITNAIPSTPTSIEVRVDKGIVTLTGRVATEEDRRKIGDAANDVKGVRSVINNIQVE